MRILYIDIDSLRPDHLGCYGYHRDTSPAIDGIAERGVRFEQCYISDAPCLPSRTALWSGRHGFRTGAVGHGGTAAQPFVEGPGRAFNDVLSRTGWMSVLRAAGYRTATVSSFGQRHSAWHWYAGFRDVLDPGGFGSEIAPQVAELAVEWLRRHAAEEDWFLHVNFWDPHTPYRTPLDFGNPFEHDAPPEWLTEEVRRRQWESYGPHSAQEPHGFGPAVSGPYPRMPASIDSMDAVKQWIDGYDTGIRYADAHVERLIDLLADANVLDETAIVIGADHGECLGELNVWGDHQTADAVTCRVPLIVRWPGIEPGVARALHYQFDWAAAILELAGCDVPENWDGRPFRLASSDAAPARESLVLSMGAWTCMRSVRWDRYICMFTYHDGYKDLAPVLLFDLEEDPHEQRDLALDRPDLVAQAADVLARWQGEMMQRSATNVDPLMTVLREGGPWQVRGHLRGYAEQLRRTGRASAAERLLKDHAVDLAWGSSGPRAT